MPHNIVSRSPLEEGKYLCQEALSSITTPHLRQRRLCMREPERHVHGPVHLNGRRELGAGLLPLAGLVIQPAQPVVAVGL